MRLYEFILIVLREHRQVVLGEHDVDIAGAFAICIERPKACGNVRTGTVSAVRTALLDVRLAGGPVGADSGIDPDDRADLVHEGQQLIELLGCDLLVLGTRIADHLVLIHFLVAGQDIGGLVPAAGEDAR